MHILINRFIQSLVQIAKEVLFSQNKQWGSDQYEVSNIKIMKSMSHSRCLPGTHRSGFHQINPVSEEIYTNMPSKIITINYQCGTQPYANNNYKYASVL